MDGERFYRVFHLAPRGGRGREFCLVEELPVIEEHHGVDGQRKAVDGVVAHDVVAHRRDEIVLNVLGRERAGFAEFRRAFFHPFLRIDQLRQGERGRQRGQPRLVRPHPGIMDEENIGAFAFCPAFQQRLLIFFKAELAVFNRDVGVQRAIGCDDVFERVSIVKDPPPLQHHRLFQLPERFEIPLLAAEPRQRESQEREKENKRGAAAR